MKRFSNAKLTHEKKGNRIKSHEQRKSYDSESTSSRSEKIVRNKTKQKPRASSNQRPEAKPRHSPASKSPEKVKSPKSPKVKENNDFCTDDDDALRWQLDPENGDSRSIFQSDGGDAVKSFIRKTMQETAFKEYQNIFSSLKQFPERLTFQTCSKNPTRNQYNDIICLDDTRVRLYYSSNQHNSNNYIHANYVDSYRQSRAYICCQGPKENTIIDFWQMVWQEDVRVIVMLTRLVEGGKNKCATYWPQEKDATKTFGQYTIKALFVEIKSNFTQTHISITCNANRETRTIAHLLFTAWPDRNIPASPLPFLQFLAHARKYQHATTVKISRTSHPKERYGALGPPMIVHCSAGVGRTGTFCAVDIFIRKMFDVKKIDLMGTVQQMRRQRAHSIQQPEQFQFVLICIVSVAINRLMQDHDEDMHSAPMERLKTSLMQSHNY